MKNKSVPKIYPIATFLSSVVNLTSFSPLFTPLLRVDTTAINTLNEIYQETDGENSSQGKFLHEVSSRLLTTLDRIYKHHTEMDNNHHLLKLGACAITKKSQGNKSCDRVKGRQKEQEERNKFGIGNENDQNVDLSNFEQGHNYYKLQFRPADLQIKEIIRPEYRRNIPHRQIHSEDYFFQGEINRKNERKYTTYHPDIKEEQTKSIPILTYRNNKQTNNQHAILPTSKRSVSPKIQSKRQPSKIQLNNISAISKKVQTDSNQSFDLDIKYLANITETVDPFLIQKQEIGNHYPYPSIKSMSSQNSQHDDKKLSNKIVQPRQRTNSEQIEEEQPWQCDEEEIQEELRQINERLSHRCDNTKRVQLNLQQQTSQILRDDSRSPRVVEFKNKEPKKVRLSLTPTKNKASPFRTKVERVKTKIIQVSSPVKLHEEEIKCQKWKKTQKGHIIVDIQRYLARE